MDSKYSCSMFYTKRKKIEVGNKNSGFSTKKKWILSIIATVYKLSNLFSLK